MRESSCAVSMVSGVGLVGVLDTRFAASLVGLSTVGPIVPGHHRLALGRYGWA